MCGMSNEVCERFGGIATRTRTTISQEFLPKHAVTSEQVGSFTLLRRPYKAVHMECARRDRFKYQPNEPEPNGGGARWWAERRFPLLSSAYAAAQLSWKLKLCFWQLSPRAHVRLERAGASYAEKCFSPAGPFSWSEAGKNSSDSSQLVTLKRKPERAIQKILKQSLN